VELLDRNDPRETGVPHHSAEIDFRHPAFGEDAEDRIPTHDALHGYDVAMKAPREASGTETLPHKPGSAAPASLEVRVIAGPAAGASALGTQIVVGRSVAADLRVGDPAVSELHLEARCHPQGILVQDLKSRNGTFLGDARVLSLIVTRAEDLRLGSTVVRIGPAAAAGQKPPERDSFGDLRGESSAARRLFGLLDRVARTELSVLIEGPTGTGKELAARGIHAASARKNGPFVVVDCSAIPLGLAESLLFGHERGAFTGSSERRAGVFEAADGGTVFLDEIGELPLDVQPRLLRVLESRTVTRVGSNTPIAFSTRVVAATRRDVRALVNEGAFRDDLYHRIAQMHVSVPALVDRREDIPLLALGFLHALPRDLDCARAISREAMAVLAEQHFPGNVRELKNTIERAAQMAEGNVIAPPDLMFDRLLDPGRQTGLEAETDDGGDLASFKDSKQTAIDDFEGVYLRRLAARVDGSLRRAALIAGVQRHYLRALFRKHGIPIGQSND
jgi:DNA-binding NtrC family response regulator